MASTKNGWCNSSLVCSSTAARQGAKGYSLFSAITTDPAHFIGIALSILFKPRHGEKKNPSRTYRLRQRLPRTSSVHAVGCRVLAMMERLMLWQSRSLSMNYWRAAGTWTDWKSGQDARPDLLAPADDDRSWPCLAVGVLGRPELEDMRRGFRISVFNKRGATWRSPTRRWRAGTGIEPLVRGKGRRFSTPTPWWRPCWKTSRRAIYVMRTKTSSMRV